MRQYVKGRPLPPLPDMEISVSMVTRNIYISDKISGDLCAAINFEFPYMPGTGFEITKLRFLISQHRLDMAERYKPESLDFYATEIKRLRMILDQVNHYGVLGQ